MIQVVLHYNLCLYFKTHYTLTLRYSYKNIWFNQYGAMFLRTNVNLIYH